MLNLEEFIQQALDLRELKRGIAVKLHLEGSTYKESANIVQRTDSFVKKWCIAYHRQGAEVLRSTPQRLILHWEGSSQPPPLLNDALRNHYFWF
jgi:hypothetical protein